MMQGLMQKWPLTVPAVLEHARRCHGSQQVVTRTVEGHVHTYTYADLDARSKLLAQALRRLGVRSGDVVATMGWNTYRHLECWYAIMGLGAVCHTLNPRLFAEQLVYIVTHAEDRVILVDFDLVPLVAKLMPAASKVVARVVVLTDRAHMPPLAVQHGWLCYEELLAAEAPLPRDFAWAPVEEDTAAGLCFTSGTTGNPKGVLYSHRSNILHSMLTMLPDMIGLSSADSVCAIVPLFHANSWGLAFSAPMAGARLVFPGPALDGKSVHTLLESQRVTLTAAVPTVWMGLLAHLEGTGGRLTTLKRVVIGGAATPESMLKTFEDKYGVEVRPAWGMTELSPLGTVNSSKYLSDPALPAAELAARRTKAGRTPFMVEMTIRDDAGKDLPWDGKTFGRLLVKGPTVCRDYFKGAGGGKDFDKNGWFDTGDVATIDAAGYMAITDRSKDVVKSGGEWISSQEIENHAVGCPGVAEAAVIGIPHEKWGERPLLIVVPKSPAAPPSKETVLDFLRPKIASWWLPDDVRYVPELPHTATGKIDKKVLRKTLLPAAKL